MMPKYICKKCSTEFWGWGVSHMYKTGKRLACPECGEPLLESKGKFAAPDLSDGFFDGPEAA